MKKYKLWLATMLVFLIYTFILFIEPSIYLSILPIIISTGVIGITIPSHSIYNHIKEKNKKNNEQETIINLNNNNKTKEKIENNIKKTENNIELNLINEMLNETSERKEKIKIKTKGTIK